MRSRPWAAVGRLETDDGVWWLKVNFAQTTYEPGLLQLLTQLDPALLPRCRTHPTQPWALIADAGRSARDVLAGTTRERQVAFWCELLPRYAELQQASTRHGWAGLDVPDLSPDRLLDRFDEAVADSRWFHPEVAPELTDAELDRIRGCRPALGRAAELIGHGLPPAIQHDDLHDGNVLLDGDDVRIIDWGDAVVAHPFGSLLVTRRSLANRWQVADDDPSLARVQDAYLDAWRTAGESASALAEQADLAVRTGALSRAAGWIRALGDPAAGQRLGFADAPSGWLSILADALEPDPSTTLTR